MGVFNVSLDFARVPARLPDPLVDGLRTPSRHQASAPGLRLAGNFASMATQTATPTASSTPLSALLKLREAKRHELREAEYEGALEKLHKRHEEERQALSRELREFEIARKTIQDQLWADKSSQGASTSATALNGRGLLPAKNELHVEVQRLLEILDEKALWEVYDYRKKIEDPQEIKARNRTLAAKRAGLWRFVSKKRVEAKRALVEREGTAEEEIAYVDKKRLGYPKFPECYEEIKNLLDIEKNPIFSKALQEWNRKEEWYNRRVERKKNRVASLKNEVYQLIGFFSVFQGVVLTAVSQSSFLFCHNKWSPIALSVLASVISTFGVIQKLNQINDLQGNIDKEERAFTTAVQVGQRLQELGPKGIDFIKLNVEIERNTNRKSKLSKKRQVAWLYFVVVILTLVAFGVLFPISFWRILCKPGTPPAQ